MIRVRKLKLQLPRHLRHEAQAVARLAAEQLAKNAPQQADATIDRIEVGPLSASKGTSRHRIAGDIAQAIGRQLAAKRGQGGEG